VSLRKCPELSRGRRLLSRTSALRFNNYQEMNSDSAPARSFINSLYCQQFDFDWLVPYPTLPSQSIADLIMIESGKFERALDASNSISECLDLVKESVLFDIGIPLEFGGDPGPPGSTGMMLVGLAEGLGSNLPFAHFYANHTAAIETILKYGSKLHKDMACIEAVSGFHTLFATNSALEIEGEKINGSCTIRGGNVSQVTSFLLPVTKEGEVIYVLLPKNTAGIVVEPLSGEWEQCRVILENVAIGEEHILPATTESGDALSGMEIEEYLIDSFRLLSAASVLGLTKSRFDAAMEVYSLKSTSGTLPVSRTNLGINHLSHMMTHIYHFESVLYAVAGKRPWSSESLTSEIVALKLLANRSTTWYDELVGQMGLLAASPPWDIYRRQLSHLSHSLPDHQCYLIIGVRGFQAQVSQAANMEKRLVESTFLFSREFRRIYGWKWNWKLTEPELPSFGWSMFSKRTTMGKWIFYTVKDNLEGRTKKDGVGTFADLGNDYNKRNKLHYEFMCRDFCHAILKHAGEYGTHITGKQWILVESGKNAAALFGWGACFGRSEKSHMAGLRGFEMEKDLALLTMDKLYEETLFNVDFGTSTWYGDSMAPWGKQRALSKLMFGEKSLA